MGKPSHWIEFEQLEKDPETLNTLIRVRMIQLVFTAENATAVRAAEMLGQLSSVTIEDDLSEFDSETLKNAKRWADEIIKRYDRGETVGDGANGSAESTD